MRAKRWQLGLCIAASAICASDTSLAKTQTVLFEVPGAVVTQPIAINVSGTITGFYQTGSSTACAQGCGFLRQPDGSLSTFAVAGADMTWPLRINASGAVVGFSSLGAFLRTPDGTVTTLSIPGSDAIARGIADDGTIVGDYEESASRRHGFIRAPDGSLTVFDPPDAQYTNVVGIDGAHEIAGTWIDAAGTYHGFVRRANGRIATYDVPGAGTANGRGTSAWAMDDEGTVVGGYTDSTGVPHSFWRTRDGTITSFDPPGYSTSWGYAAAQTGRKPAIAGQSNSTVYLRSPGGSVRILGRKFIEVNAMTASGMITGVWLKNDRGHQIGYLRMPE